MSLRVKAVRTGVYKGAMAFAGWRFTLDEVADFDPAWMDALEAPVRVIPPQRDPLDDLLDAVEAMDAPAAERGALRAQLLAERDRQRELRLEQSRGRAVRLDA